MFPLLIEFLQPQLRATQPNYFFPVVMLLLVAGGVAWLIAVRTWFCQVAGVRAFCPLVLLRGRLHGYLSPALPAVRDICRAGYLGKFG